MLKITTLIIAITFLFFVTSVFAQQTNEKCDVARPWFGSVNCQEEDQWSALINVPNSQSWACTTPDCQIASYDQFSCNVFGTVYKGVKITRGQSVILDCSTNYIAGNTLDCKTGNIPIDLHSGDIITVDFWCNNIVSTFSPPGSPNVQVRYRPIALKLHYDSGENFVSGTEQCKMDNVYNQYYSKQPSSPSLIQSISSTIQTTLFPNSAGITIPSNNIVGNLQPKDLQVDQGYWLVYDWVTRPDLIISYTKDNTPVWCNVADHSLTKFEKVTTQGQNCYLIPTQRLSQQVECCSSDECKLAYSDQSVQCTNDFKCGYDKSCLSDFDCGGSSSTCEVSNGQYYLTSSSCDKSKLDSYGKGKCVSAKQQVSCCTGQDGGPNTCGAGSFCDYSKGCQTILQKCPSGACCKEGGQYLVQDCPSGQQCCASSTSLIGECKTSCNPVAPNLNDINQVSNPSSQEDALSAGTGMGSLLSSPNFYLLIGIVVLAAVAFVGYIFWKNKQSEEPLSKKESRKDKKDLLGGDI